MIRANRLKGDSKHYPERPEAGRAYGTRRNRPVGIIVSACSVANPSAPYFSALRTLDKMLSVRVSGLRRSREAWVTNFPAT